MYLDQKKLIISKLKLVNINQKIKQLHKYYYNFILFKLRANLLNKIRISIKIYIIIFIKKYLKYLFKKII